MRNALMTRGACRPGRGVPGFERFFDGFFEDLAGQLSPETAAWRPAIDVEKTDNTWTIRADVPGVAPEDIKVSLRDGRLTVEGERKESEEKGNDDARWVERRRGAFSRAVVLPDDVDGDAIRAKYGHGVLEIQCPVKPESLPREIEVSVN